MGAKSRDRKSADDDIDNYDEDFDEIEEDLPEGNNDEAGRQVSLNVLYRQQKQYTTLSFT